MLVKVLHTFPYAHDGHSTVLLGLGDHEVRDELVPGLVAEGLVAKPAPAVKPVEAPAAAKPKAPPPAAPVAPAAASVAAKPADAPTVDEKSAPPVAEDSDAKPQA